MEAAIADLQKQLGKKQTFEAASYSLAALIRDHYALATPSEQRLMYGAACRVATLLQTRYTARGFWLAGLNLFQEAEKIATKDEEKGYMKTCISRAIEFLGDDAQREHVPSSMQAGTSSGYLFEGQLTVDAEPLPPAWLVAQNALTALALQQDAANFVRNDSTDQVGEEIFELVQSMHSLGGLEEAIQATLQEIASTPQGPPPASKDEVAKLSVVTVTEQLLKDLGAETECAVCREQLILDDRMQQMPCKHFFHPDCLKPWLDKHNSCPICRFEMRTDDHEYESRKEREREAEEERKGAANAVRGGEFMYI